MEDFRAPRSATFGVDRTCDPDQLGWVAEREVGPDLFREQPPDSADAVHVRAFRSSDEAPVQVAPGLSAFGETTREHLKRRHPEVTGEMRLLFLDVTVVEIDQNDRGLLDTLRRCSSPVRHCCREHEEARAFSSRDHGLLMEPDGKVLCEGFAVEPGPNLRAALLR
jgi:hypothetical protein